jgi:formamidopyrimidine-DNA glycosylase
MIEIPESANLAREISETMKGKKIVSAVADYSPHKFAWYHGDPRDYNDLLEGRIIEGANGFGGMVEILVQGVIILFTDGVSIRYHGKGEKRPEKHQLLIEFEDETALSASVQMYGGLWCFREGDFGNIYYKVSKEKPSPLSDEFDRQYYDELFFKTDLGKMSLKSFLATEQRIPGLGNGVLQDILLSAGLHPKKKAVTLTEDEALKLISKIYTT